MAQTLYAENLTEQLYLEDGSLYMFDSESVKKEPASDYFSDSSEEQPIYADLTAVQYSPAKLNLLKTEKTKFAETYDNLLSWTNKHPENWTDCEVLDWVYYVADKENLDCSQLRGESYQALTGQQLCRMTREDFTAVDGQFGPLLYDLFQSLVQKSKFLEPVSPDTINPEQYPFLDTTYPCLPVPYSTLADPDLSVFVNDKGDTSVNIDGCMYDFDTKIEIPDQTYCSGSQRFTPDLGYCSGESDMESSNAARCDSTSSEYDAYNISDDDDIQMTSYGSYMTHSFAHRPINSVSSEEDLMDSRPVPPRRKMTTSSKGNHLWEFIRDLLRDPNLNPSLLRWEDKEAGVFKFVQSEAVASMWGRKKNNPGMTYEKLSRAMRFCRTSGYFSDVPKNGKFPKKLCFRFGPKAHDWK